MRRSACLAVLVVAIVTLGGAAARAQPVSYQVQTDAGVGQRPAIKITAAQAVRDIRLELERDDGTKFTAAHPALARGQAVTLAIGDGAPGRAAFKGTVSAQVPGEAARWSEPLAFETLVRAPVKIGYDFDHLDLDQRVLKFTLSRPAGSAELTAIGEDGKPLGSGTATYRREAPGTWLAISWTQPAGARVMMLKLRAVTAEGLAATVELVPWSVAVEHEDVLFATDSAVIAPSEHAKLDASVAKIGEIVARSQRFVKMRLYVAGHTDTVGPGPRNRALSLARARAIAAYFRKRGVALPIAFAGFGEDVPKVKTADETDAPANRRADYVIGPEGAPPPFRGPYLRVRADWARLE